MRRCSAFSQRPRPCAVIKGAQRGTNLSVFRASHIPPALAFPCPIVFSRRICQLACFTSFLSARYHRSLMSSTEIKTIAVLGAGTMGNGITHVFARSGYHVLLRDIEQRFLDRALETIAKNLDREVRKNKITEADKSA